MNQKSKRIITVFGTSAAVQNDPVFQAGISLGRLLAAAGFDIANGGYGGTMHAVAEGASGLDAKIYGITCSAFRRSRANEFITDEIKTENLNQRLAKLVDMADGYIVLPGGTGTLLELAWVWEHKNKRFETAQKPIVLLGSFWKPLVELLEPMDAKSTGCIDIAETPEKAVGRLTEYFSDRKD